VKSGPPSGSILVGAEPTNAINRVLGGRAVQRHWRRMPGSRWAVNDQGRKPPLSPVPSALRYDAEADATARRPAWAGSGNQRPPTRRLQQQGRSAAEARRPPSTMNRSAIIRVPAAEAPATPVSTGQQGCDAGIDRRGQRNQFISPRRKDVLVRMERENRLADSATSTTHAYP